MKGRVKIKDAFVLFKKSKIKAGEGLDKGDYPFYTSSSTLNKYLDSYEIEEESLILGTGGSASVHYSKGKFSTSTDCFVIQNTKFDIDLKYVYLYLLGNIQILENGFKGAGLKHISKKYLENVEIPLPTLEIQKKIIEVLDKAQALIDARKEQISLMDELIKAVFYEMFGDPGKNPKGWEEIKLKEVVDTLSGYAFKSKLYTDDKTQAVLCGGLIIMPDRIVWEDSNYYPISEVEKLEKYRLVENDIVMALDRPWISSGFKIGQVKSEDPKAYLVQRTARLRGVKCNQSFLYYLLGEKDFMIHCKPTETTVPHISIKDINSYNAIMPPINLQNDFAMIIQSIEKQIFCMQQSLIKLETNYKSLVFRAFNGDLFGGV